jgi:hypothetical protein
VAKPFSKYTNLYNSCLCAGIADLLREDQGVGAAIEKRVRRGSFQVVLLQIMAADGRLQILVTMQV